MVFLPRLYMAPLLYLVCQAFQFLRFFLEKLYIISHGYISATLNLGQVQAGHCKQSWRGYFLTTFEQLDEPR